MALRYLSVCSGIESASVAWEPLGWTPVAFSEIERFPSLLLATRWPDVPNLGDFTAIDPAALGPIDLLVGGTPCQAFSVAGKRGSLADARGNLTLAFVDLAHGLADAAGCRWAVWENVPGVLSTPDNAFGCFLGRLVGGDGPVVPPGATGWGPHPHFDAERYDVHRTYRFQSCPWPRQGMVSGPRARAAWRILDAQYFGLAQRRERVFVVVGLADGADPAAVLFEPQGLHRHSPSRGETEEGVAGTLDASAGRSRGAGINPGSLSTVPPVQSVALRGREGGGTIELGGDVAFTLRASTGGGDKPHVLANSEIIPEGISEVAATLAASSSSFGGYRNDADTAENLIPIAFGGNDTRGPIKVSTALNAHGGPHGRLDFESETFIVAHTLRGDGIDASEDGTGRGTPIVPVAFDCKAGGDTGFSIGPIAGALRGTGHGGGHAAVAFGISSDCFDRSGEGTDCTAGARSGLGITEELSPTLKAKRPNAVATEYAVRRLTPKECHRLQGFPDDHCALDGAADGPIYKALGNSKAVPVVRWLGARIASVEAAREIRVAAE